jgi:hypothetical protein
MSLDLNLRLAGGGDAGKCTSANAKNGWNRVAVDGALRIAV